MVRQVISNTGRIKMSDNQQFAILAYVDDLVRTTKNEGSLK